MYERVRFTKQVYRLGFKLVVMCIHGLKTPATGFDGAICYFAFTIQVHRTCARTEGLDA